MLEEPSGARMSLAHPTIEKAHEPNSNSQSATAEDPKADEMRDDKTRQLAPMSLTARSRSSMSSSLDPLTPEPAVDTDRCRRRGIGFRDTLCIGIRFGQAARPSAII